VYNDCPALM